MPAPITVSSYTRAHARRRPAAGRKPLLVAAIILAILVVGYGGYRGVRFVAHRVQAAGTASSHALNKGQLGSLTKVSGTITDDQSFQHTLLTAADPSPSPAPSGAVLQVPYTVQAPNNNWKVHEESCEEAAILMYHDFLEGDTRSNIPATEADQQLRALKAWQVQNWGAERDLGIDRTGQLAEAYYGYKYQVIDVTEASIKASIAAGHPLVVPVMTHALQNPHYGPNSVYHELLIKGYTPDGVVTNDAGVQEGKDWFYSWSILFGAIDAQAPKGLNQGRPGLILTR